MFHLGQKVKDAIKQTLVCGLTHLFLLVTVDWGKVSCKIELLIELLSLIQTEQRDELVMEDENSFPEVKGPTWIRPCLSLYTPNHSLVLIPLAALPSETHTSHSFFDSDTFCWSFSLLFTWLVLSYSLNPSSSMKPSLITRSKVEPAILDGYIIACLSPKQQNHALWP